MSPHLNLNPHQMRNAEPTAFENALSDALEAAFGAGHWELEPLLVQLNANGPPLPDGQAWNADNFQGLMAKLGSR